MRSTESNFRGVRSESGILTENSFSSADTRSASVKESSAPDSNSDSSGVGLMGFPATCLTISMIFVCRSMIWLASGSSSSDFRPRLLIFSELLHHVGKHHRRQAMIAGRRKVDEIPLCQTCIDPVAHGALAAHAFAGVPEGAAVFLAGRLLRFDDEIDTGHHLLFASHISPP